jgi:hypothetical protein
LFPDVAADEITGGVDRDRASVGCERLDRVGGGQHRVRVADVVV